MGASCAAGHAVEASAEQRGLTFSLQRTLLEDQPSLKRRMEEVHLMARFANTFGVGLLAAAALTVAPANARLLFENPATATACGAGCWASGGSATEYFRTWDNFSIIGDATVTSATWHGIAYDAGLDLTDLDTVSWDLGFFADGGGTPGAEVFNVTLADAQVTRTFLGTGGIAGRLVNYWEFSATLPIGFDVSGGATYWFSPFSNQTDYYPVFAWSGSLGGNTYQVDDGGSSFVRTNNRAFTLSGPVPEPQTWAMMILGFGAIGTAWRARRRGAAVAASEVVASGT